MTSDLLIPPVKNEDNLFGVAREIVQVLNRLPPQERGILDSLHPVMDASPTMNKAYVNHTLVPHMPDREEAYRQIGQLVSGLVPASAVCAMVPFLMQFSRPQEWRKGAFKGEAHLPNWMKWIWRHNGDVRGTFMWARHFVGIHLQGAWAPKRATRMLVFGHGESSHDYWRMCSDDSWDYWGSRPFSSKGTINMAEKVLTGILRDDWVSSYVGMLHEMEAAFAETGGRIDVKNVVKHLSFTLQEIEDRRMPALFPSDGRPLPFTPLFEEAWSHTLKDWS